jgi:dTDP-4-dehydrorhamnose reductase
MKVVVLGATGMLGAMVTEVLACQATLRVVGTVRDQPLLEMMRSVLPEVDWCIFDAERDGPEVLTTLLSGSNWAVNAIGIIKPYIRDDDPGAVARAVAVNSLFPHKLAAAAEAEGVRVLQIATDCVYSGSKGAYLEDAAHDALDVYGKTKSLGEVYSPLVHHLRCSIIGPEIKAHRSLLDWLLQKPQGATVTGFTNHYWNGVTTLHFARLCAAVIRTGIEIGHSLHIVPAAPMSKYELLQSLARANNRHDIKVNAGAAAVSIDRTLATKRPELNRKLWAATDYAAPPTVPQLVTELAAFNARFARQTRASV